MNKVVDPKINPYDKDRIALKQLRIEFAKAALTGLLANSEWCAASIVSIADNAFEYADAMIERLNK